MDLENIKGIGKKGVQTLNTMGINNIVDLVKYYPYRFDVLARRSLDDENYYDNMVVDGIVESIPIVNFFGKKKNKLTFRANVQNKIIKCVIFNRAFMKRNIEVGKYVTLIGKYDSKNETMTLNNIYLSKLPDTPVIIPIYHMTKGFSKNQIRKVINEALNSYQFDFDLPKVLYAKYRFINIKDAIKIIHNPQNNDELKEAIKVLKYEELFTYMLNVKKLKEKNQIHDKKYSKKIDKRLVDEYVKTIPFELTRDQKKVIDEMIYDLENDTKMNRLLQGDVGSGKTIVAFIISYAVYTSGYQSVMMAPTEILAEQHYNNAVKMFSNAEFRVGLLTGKMTSKEKKDVYNKILNNEIDFLIGTHALISDSVVWNKLGLVITDEQHRFGVNQRLKLEGKSVSPDTIMMSATPIPRTYALTIYGDTDVSSIKSKPKGRLPIITKVKKNEELKDVLTRIYNSLTLGNQAYVIAPMIEESEETDYTNVYDLKHKFELAFKKYTVEILHGKITKDEKNKIMDDYLNKKIDILISTTVIEVGVDVPNATVMVIFDADKFGLSTLHQLRGRVGRNNIQSYCYLISDKEKERLKVMENTNDGYEISEADFKLRGQGDLFGNRQSGDLSFKLSDVKKDYDLLAKVKDDVYNYFDKRM